jgi:uncharacterized surface protein with fasciclin (FAS1) repeats
MRLKTLVFAATAALASPALYVPSSFAGMHESKAEADIVDTAAANADFSTLVAAIKAAGLVETLKGEGPFTVFAPTNAAFAALPAGTLDNLLKPENKDQLVAILTYHVVPGKVMAGDLLGKTTEAATAQGANVSVVGDAEAGVTVNGAKVTTADIAAKNGVIHVIDAVILPPAKDATTQ